MKFINILTTTALYLKLCLTFQTNDAYDNEHHAIFFTNVEFTLETQKDEVVEIPILNNCYLHLQGEYALRNYVFSFLVELPTEGLQMSYECPRRKKNNKHLIKSSSAENIPRGEKTKETMLIKEKPKGIMGKREGEAKIREAMLLRTGGREERQTTGQPYSILKKPITNETTKLVVKNQQEIGINPQMADSYLNSEKKTLNRGNAAPQQNPRVLKRHVRVRSDDRVMGGPLVNPILMTAGNRIPPPKIDQVQDKVDKGFFEGVFSSILNKTDKTKSIKKTSAEEIPLVEFVTRPSGAESNIKKVNLGIDKAALPREVSELKPETKISSIKKYWKNIFDKKLPVIDLTNKTQLLTVKRFTMSNVIPLTNGNLQFSIENNILKFKYCFYKRGVILNLMNISDVARNKVRKYCIERFPDFLRHYKKDSIQTLLYKFCIKFKYVELQVKIMFLESEGVSNDHVFIYEEQELGEGFDKEAVLRVYRSQIEFFGEILGDKNNVNIDEGIETVNGKIKKEIDEEKIFYPELDKKE
jgi:hypothetical protein